MTEETKSQIMQYLQKLAGHFEIPNAELVSFKKRQILLDLLNTKDTAACDLANELINATLQNERIKNDKEKQTKKPDHWNEEVIASQNKMDAALSKLLNYFEHEGIK